MSSRYYTDNPLYPLANAVANLNIDMVGRTDPKRESKNRNYIYLIGTDRLSKELHEISEYANQATVKMELDYTYNAADDPNRFYFRSDHYNFAKNNIPVIFYFNGHTRFKTQRKPLYHKVSNFLSRVKGAWIIQVAYLQWLKSKKNLCLKIKHLIIDDDDFLKSYASK